MEVSQNIEDYESLGNAEIMIECPHCCTVYEYASFKQCYNCGTAGANKIWISERVKLKTK